MANNEFHYAADVSPGPMVARLIDGLKAERAARPAWVPTWTAAKVLRLIARYGLFLGSPGHFLTACRVARSEAN